MHFEVENKFPVVDSDALRRKLEARGAVFAAAVSQCDAYFAHPARDFAATDEALRIRRVGRDAWVTYKGPKIDSATKTRRELEFLLAAGTAEDFAELLAVLGFRPVAEVNKRRLSGELTWQEWPVTVALDFVAGLGAYLEIEVAADEANLDSARACLHSLAAELSLGPPERRGYLDLLLRPAETPRG